MDISKEELGSVIETAVGKALDTLGLDVKERQELRKDFIYLRARRLEVEAITEEQLVSKILDKDWVRKKRVQGEKRIEFVKSHIAKTVGIGVFLMVMWTLFGERVLTFF